MEAEQAARMAHASAEKAIRLLQASEQSSHEVEEYRKKYEMQQSKLESLAGAVSPALTKLTKTILLFPGIGWFLQLAGLHAILCLVGQMLRVMTASEKNAGTLICCVSMRRNTD